MSASAARASEKEDSVFPPDDHDTKKRRQRMVKGKRLERPFVFLPPDHLRKWVEDLETGGRTRTMVLLRALDISKDIMDELGVEWFDIEKRASLDRATPGQVIGRMVKRQLEADLKTKK